jgi:hypothetical protein
VTIGTSAAAHACQPTGSSDLDTAAELALAAMSNGHIRRTRNHVCAMRPA